MGWDWGARSRYNRFCRVVFDEFVFLPREKCTCEHPKRHTRYRLQVLSQNRDHVLQNEPNFATIADQELTQKRFSKRLGTDCFWNKLIK